MCEKDYYTDILIKLRYFRNFFYASTCVSPQLSVIEFVSRAMRTASESTVHMENCLAHKSF